MLTRNHPAKPLLFLNFEDACILDCIFILFASFIDWHELLRFFQAHITGTKNFVVSLLSTEKSLRSIYPLFTFTNKSYPKVYKTSIYLSRNNFLGYLLSLCGALCGLIDKSLIFEIKFGQSQWIGLVYRECCSDACKPFSAACDHKLMWSIEEEKLNFLE